jgi:threonine dehydrogenase-like Zn-dependent dehydrogenase
LEEYNSAAKPFIPGHEGVGVVTKAGKNVKKVKEGDLITTYKWSEHTNLKEEYLVKLRANKEDAENYLVEPVSCIVNAVFYLNIYPGDGVIVFGVGYMGLLLTQMLNHCPLSRLIVVDSKPENLTLAHNFGADEVINYQTTEGLERLKELRDEPFDITYECSGDPEALNSCTELTKTGGKIGIFARHHDKRVVDLSEWHLKGLQVINISPLLTVNERMLRSFESSEKLISAGVITQRSLITHRYEMDEISKAMADSRIRGKGFIKSVLCF